MEITQNSTVGELTARHYGVSSVFKKYGINYSCKGKLTLKESDTDSNIQALIAELNAFFGQLKEGEEYATIPDYNSWELDKLAQHIQSTHHKYVEEQVKVIIPILEELASTQTEKSPNFEQVVQVFKASAGELSVHMKKEELMLFPKIKKMVEASQSNQSLDERLRMVKGPIQMLIHDHDGEVERMEQIAKWTNQYTAENDSDEKLKRLYQLLHEFEEDLLLHLHLENNILFPKAVQLQEELASV